MEIPNFNSLNFLDTTIYIENNQSRYKWHEKETNSGNSLNKNCFVPNHVKTNYIDNTIKYVKNRCSTPGDFEEAKVALDKKFNGNVFKITMQKKKKGKMMILGNNLS